MHNIRRLVLIPVAIAIAAALVVRSRGPEPIRHVILFIGDGMQLAHEVAASRYLYDKDDGLAWHAFPYQTDVTTWDVTTYNKFAGLRKEPPYDQVRFNPTVGYDPALGGSRPYPLVTSEAAERYFLPPGGTPFATDSASAATAWATGVKTDDGNIAWLPGDPDGGRLPTLASLLRAERGFAIGIVTTMPFTHATPAAQVSHNVSRNNYRAIAEEIVRAVKPDVVIGGGHPDYTATYMPKPLVAELKADPAYVVTERQANVDGAAALASAARAAIAKGKKLFGLFGGASGNFESPVPVDAPGFPEVRPATPENPRLADATRAALDALSRDKDGFFVLIEQGDIDAANHDNNYARMIGTMWDLDQAVRAAAAFVDRPGDGVTWENTLLVVTADHANSGMRLNPAVRLRAGDLPAQDGKPGAFTYPDAAVSYGTEGHTNELVMIYARGAAVKAFQQYEGTWYPCTRIIDNTQIFNALAGAAGLSARSPLHPIVAREPCRADGR